MYLNKDVIVAGVEEVMVDISKNEVTIKGIVDPQALCMRLQRKTKRTAKVLSPPPPAEGETQPQIVSSQVQAHPSTSSSSTLFLLHFISIGLNFSGHIVTGE